MFCKNCGADIPDNAVFCGNCGMKVNGEAPKTDSVPNQEQKQTTYQTYQQAQQSQPQYQQVPPVQPQYQQANARGYMGKPTIEIRGVALAIVLSLVTCGIYSLIWLYNAMSDIKKVTGETDGVIGEFLLFIFVPFYSIYWFYSREKRFVEASARYGITVEDKSVIMLVLSLFGFGIIDLALMQDDLNKFYGA